jgi:hypothetical protein
MGVALHATEWDISFARRALSFLKECAVSPSFIPKKYPADFKRFSFPALVLPSFEEMVSMYRVLSFLGVPEIELSPLMWEIRDHEMFLSSDVQEDEHFSGPPDTTLISSGGIFNPIIKALAHRGYLSAIQYLRGRGCGWDEWVCAYAAGNGYLNVLQWVRSQDPPCPWDGETTDAAVMYGQLDILKWLQAQDPPCPFYNRTGVLNLAVHRGHTEIVVWLLAHEFLPNSGSCRRAAEYGHLDILKLLRGRAPPMSLGQTGLFERSS